MYLPQLILRITHLRQGKLDSWYIHIVMVQREHQGKGVGKSLIDQVVQKVLASSDYTMLTLLVF